MKRYFVNGNGEYSEIVFVYFIGKIVSMVVYNL